MRRLDIKEIWTTNYDRLLETAIPEAVVVAGEDHVHNIASRRRAIIKMHGSIDNRNEWELPPVITRTDYERYELAHPRTWTVLRSSYMSRTMLFLGFSFTDPNIEILLRLARTLGTASADRHIAVMKPPMVPMPHRKTYAGIDSRPPTSRTAVSQSARSTITTRSLICSPSWCCVPARHTCSSRAAAESKTQRRSKTKRSWAPGAQRSLSPSSMNRHGQSPASVDRPAGTPRGTSRGRGGRKGPTTPANS
ncbi:SIR2 family protein [Rhodococcus aetherivorans]